MAMSEKGRKMWGQIFLKCRDFLSPQELKERPAASEYLVQAKLASWAAVWVRGRNSALEAKDLLYLVQALPRITV